MKKLTRLLLTLPILLVLVAVAGLSLLGWKSRNETPAYLAKRDLALDNGNPNFVSSLVANPERRIEPLTSEGNPEDAWKQAIAAILAAPRTEARIQENDYFRAESRSRIFGFVDDIELLRSGDDGTIHIRSSSRVGRSDLGENAKRVKSIRQRFEEAPRN